MSEVDKSREDEWFLRNERELIETARKARAKREAERTSHEREEERRRLKDLHFMRCPKCGHELREETIDGVQVDRCSFCEGLYLDAGELDKLMLQRDEQRRGFLKRVLGL